jgi:hypothetical protein
MEKSVLFAIALVSVATASMFFGDVSHVEAKSVKWSCIALDPTTPWIQTCYSSTRRP